MRESNVKGLNNILKGEYMAVDKYNSYIKNVDDENLKRDLANIQEEHKKQISTISQRVEQLGGNAVNGPGIQGVFTGIMSNIITPKEKEKIVREALDGEQMGIHSTEELLPSFTDENSKKIVSDVLTENKNIVNTLSKLLTDSNIQM